MPRFDLCVFDLDGTLARTLPAIHQSLNAVLQRHGFPTHTEAAVTEMIGEGLRALVDRAVPADASPRDQVLATVSREYGEELVRLSRLTESFTGVPEMLDALAAEGVLLAVCSNKPTPAVERTLASCFGERRGLFLAALGVEEGRPPKPHPQGVREIMAAARAALAGRGASGAGAAEAGGQEGPGAAGGPNLHALFVGDSHVDIETARAAGIPCVACAWGYAGSRGLGGAAAVVGTAQELQDIVLGRREL